MSGTDNVRVSVCGRQTVDGRSDVVELQTTGRFQIVGSHGYLTYCEPESAVNVTLKLRSGRAVMIRSGDASSRMEFISGADTVCDYDGGGGAFLLEIHTHEVSAVFSPNSGRALLRYTLSSGGRELSGNEVQIRLSPL